MTGVLLRTLAYSFLFCLLAACGQKAEDDIAEALPPQSYGEETTSNVELWLETMELGSRELYSARNDVVSALQLKSGERIADIGAGTGLYTVLFAQSVGEAGAVFAVDIEPRFLKLINQRTADLDFTNVTSVLGLDNSITLPDASTDVVFISDTYNYFEDPQALMRSVFKALKPGGRLFIVDFDLVDGEPRNENNQHVRVGKRALIMEVESIGFALDEEVSVPNLTASYMLRFRKPAETGGGIQ